MPGGLLPPGGGPATSELPAGDQRPPRTSRMHPLLDVHSTVFHAVVVLWVVLAVVIVRWLPALRVYRLR